MKSDEYIQSIKNFIKDKLQEIDVQDEATLVFTISVIINNTRISKKKRVAVLLNRDLQTHDVRGQISNINSLMSEFSLCKLK